MEEILLFHPKTFNKDSRVQKCNFYKGLIDFSRHAGALHRSDPPAALTRRRYRTFHPTKLCEMVNTDTAVIAFVECEPDLWMIMVSRSLRRAPRSLPDAAGHRRLRAHLWTARTVARMHQTSA